MAEQGTVIVDGVKFSWWTTDGDRLLVTVSHPVYGSKSERDGTSPELPAQVLAKELLAECRQVAAIRR